MSTKNSFGQRKTYPDSEFSFYKTAQLSFESFQSDYDSFFDPFLFSLNSKHETFLLKVRNYSYCFNQVSKSTSI